MLYQTILFKIADVELDMRKAENFFNNAIEAHDEIASFMWKNKLEGLRKTVLKLKQQLNQLPQKIVTEVL